MPTPMPRKMNPLARPRRAGGTCGSTRLAATIISTPPAMPATTRQSRNQAKPACQAQARNEAAESAIIPRSSGAAGSRRASGRAASAPPR